MFNKIWIGITLLFVSTLSDAQFYKSFLPSTEFSDALASIIIDFGNNYQNIQGERIANNGTSETFLSNVILPGSLETYIHHGLDTCSSIFY